MWVPINFGQFLNWHIYHCCHGNLVNNAAFDQYNQRPASRIGLQGDALEYMQPDKIMKYS